MAIRQAKLQDIPDLEELAQMFYGASGLSGDFHMDKFISFWEGQIQTGNGVILIDESYLDITGAIGGLIYPDLYTGEMLAIEFFWFVHPEKRGEGMKLYYAFEEWVRSKEVKQIRMAYLIESMPEKLKSLYERLGYRQIEVHYAKEI